MQRVHQNPELTIFVYFSLEKNKIKVSSLLSHLIKQMIDHFISYSATFLLFNVLNTDFYSE